MYTLHKYSRPAWSKKYETIQALTSALLDETCRLCTDSYGTDIQSLLASDCGCEYGVDGLVLDGPLTEAETWQDHYEVMYGK